MHLMLTLCRDAKRMSFAPKKVAFGSDSPGHDHEEKRIHSAMQATQTHGHTEVDVETFCSANRQQDVMQKMKTAAWAKANDKDNEVKRASSDVKSPVSV